MAEPARTAQRAAYEVVAFVADRETAASMEASLMGAAAEGSLVQRGAVTDAIRYLENAVTPPRLLFVDLSGLETPLSMIDRLADVCEPSIVVVAIGDRENVLLFRELMRAGVADYITKPVLPDLIDPYVRERRASVFETAANARRGHVVTFVGARGGVGATTLAVACARRMAEQEKRRVAYIDLDMHGGAACVQLGVPPGGLSDALTNHRRLDALFLERTLIRVGPRLSVMAEEVGLRDEPSIEPEALDDLLRVLADDFHYVFLDMPRRYGPLHVHVVMQARTRVLVVDRTLPALRDGARVMAIAREALGATTIVANDHHPGLRNALTAETMEKALGRKPDVEVDYDRAAAQTGDNMGEPLGLGRGPLSTAAERLTATFSGRARPARRSLLRSLRFGRRS